MVGSRDALTAAYHRLGHPHLSWTQHEEAGVCGFWDGSYDKGKCGGGIVRMAFSKPHGWFTFYKSVALYQFLGCWSGWMRDAYWQFTSMDGKVLPLKACNLFGLLRLRLCLYSLQYIFRRHASHVGWPGPSPPPLCRSWGWWRLGCATLRRRGYLWHWGLGHTVVQGSSGEKMGNLGGNTGMAADESQEQERSDRWGTNKGRKVHFSSLMDLCHLKKSGAGT